MNTIGFSNFRRFTFFPEMDLGDITILVGGNNAGKSTLVKAMLLMRDFLKSRIESVDKTGSIFKTIKPQFKFDAEHVNVGEFYRAFCRQSPSKEDTMSFSMRIDKFHFVVNIRGERKPGVIPEVSMISVKDEDEDCSFSFDFTQGQMSARFGYDRKALNSYNLDRRDYLLIEKLKVQENELRDKLNELEKILSRSKDLEMITVIKDKIQQGRKALEMIITQKRMLIEKQNRIAHSIEEYDSVTVSMSYFAGYNIGDYLITELIKGFVNYAYVGTLGDKRSNEYKEQESKKSFLRGKETEIKVFAKELKDVLNRQKIEYIYAHSVSQTPIYANCIGSDNYVNRTVHEFYNARINKSEEEFDYIEKWLKEFNIGNSLEVKSHAGDSYQVFIMDDENPKGMDLADKGMGSIQLVILLLRLATLIRKYKGQALTVLLEEPEQNLHPAVQSMLADLAHDINKNFGVQFIIETHSEYLVRKSQVIVGMNYDTEKKAKANPFRIYYLPQSGQAYSIGYTLNGRLTDKFEPGFFDEAGKSNFYLMRKERGLE